MVVNALAVPMGEKTRAVNFELDVYRLLPPNELYKQIGEGCSNTDNFLNAEILMGGHSDSEKLLLIVWLSSQERNQPRVKLAFKGVLLDLLKVF